MKRDKPIKYPNGIQKEFPLLFWKFCYKCNKEFIREKGFSFIVGPYHGGIGKRKYVCGSCCPTIQDADELACNYTNNIPRPKYPSAPPPPPTHCPPQRVSEGKGEVNFKADRPIAPTPPSIRIITEHWTVD